MTPGGKWYILLYHITKGGTLIKSTAIICEYNPVHKGHAYLISRARETGAGCVICVMSGNCVQRGEPAIADKYVRASAAIRAGADLVVELPFPWSCASSEFFAAAGVTVSARLGADALCFGSECGDVSRLAEISRAGIAPRGGYSIGAAKEWADAVGLENAPNDLLAAAYLSAIDKYAPALEPICVKRIGADYNDTDAGSQFPSAAAIRAEISAGRQFESCLPDGVPEILRTAREAGRFPVSKDIFGLLVLSALRNADPVAASACAECGGGVAERLISAAESSSDRAGFESAVATKRYTNARLRRASVFAATGVLPDDISAIPAYTTLLAANAVGCDFLAETRRTRKIPVVTKPADIPDGKSAERQRALSDNFDKLFTLAMPKPRNSGFFSTLSPEISEKG